MSLQVDVAPHFLHHMSKFPVGRHFEMFKSDDQFAKSKFKFSSSSPQVCLNDESLRQVWKKSPKHFMLKHHEGNRNEISEDSLFIHTPLTEGFKPQITKIQTRAYFTLSRDIVMLIFWKWTAYISTMVPLTEMFRIWISLWVLGDRFKLSTSSWIWIKKKQLLSTSCSIPDISLLCFWKDGWWLFHE